MADGAICRSTNPPTILRGTVNRTTKNALSENLSSSIDRSQTVLLKLKSKVIRPSFFKIFLYRISLILNLISRTITQPDLKQGIAVFKSRDFHLQNSGSQPP